jgi:hypothetical protein
MDIGFNHSETMRAVSLIAPSIVFPCAEFFYTGVAYFTTAKLNSSPDVKVWWPGALYITFKYCYINKPTAGEK